MTDHQHTAETLNRAADLIEERGWTTGNVGMKVGGPFCLMGAMGAVVGSIRDDGEKYYYPCPGTDHRAATEVVADYLGKTLQGWSVEPLFTWNDAKGRTASEVIEVLRAAAAIEQSKADAEQPVAVSS